MDRKRDANYSGPAATGPSRGWLSRTWLRFVLVLVVLGLVFCGAVCGWIAFGALSKKWSEPYQIALEQVQADARVIERMGQPIADVIWPPPTGELNWKDDQGEANLAFGVQGPKGGAEVLVQARRVAGRWGIISLNVVFGDNSRISLDVESKGAEQGGLEDAPAWKP